MDSDALVYYYWYLTLLSFSLSLFLNMNLKILLYLSQKYFTMQKGSLYVDCKDQVLLLFKLKVKNA